MYYVVFPSTGAVRGFSHFNLVAEWYSAKTPVYSNEYELEKLTWLGKPFPLEEMRNNVLRRNGVVSSNLTAWDVLVKYADVIDRPPGGEVPQTAQPLRKGFKVNLSRLGDLAGNAPKQARALVSILKEKQYDFYTTNEIKETLNEVKSLMALKTKQNPWRIWRYYLPSLVEAGIVEMNE